MARRPSAPISGSPLMVALVVATTFSQAFNQSSCSSLSILIRNSTVFTEHTLHGAIAHAGRCVHRTSPHYRPRFCPYCMSHSSLRAVSSSNFQPILILIFDDAIREIAQRRIYCKAVAHPRSAWLLACDSLGAVLGILQRQAVSWSPIFLCPSRLGKHS